jgi:serine-type D-Ala-D-Ala carboxypeptidase (penicillin-binding protein 5/6)
VVPRSFSETTPGSQSTIACLPLVLRALFACIIVAFFGLGSARALETGAHRALIVEADSGTLLYAKGLDETFAPGNFAKLMTAAVTFDALSKGEISPGTMVRVSEYAWRTGGAPARVTTMFAAVRSEIAVEDLIKGLIVHYANDAAILLAEAVAGSEDAFAQRMNELAAEIGMSRSRFANPTGYADPRARVTVTDLRRLIDHIRTRHPEQYALYGMPEFEWNKILQRNKTSYVHDLPGAEGLVLAYDEADGFSAAVSTVRDGRRILVVASGFQRPSDRDQGIKALVDAAYRDFAPVTLYQPGSIVGTVRVFGGTVTRIPVQGDGPIRVTLPKGERNDFRLAVVYDGPVQAPIEKGQRIAALEIRKGDIVYQTVPLIAADDVPVGDLQARARDGFTELLFGWW